MNKNTTIDKKILNQEKVITTLIASALIGLVVLVLDFKSWMVEIETERKSSSAKLVEFDGSIKALNSLLNSLNVNITNFNKNQEMTNYKLDRLTSRVIKIEDKD